MITVNIPQLREDILHRLMATGRPGMDKLAAFLMRSDFFTAPASISHHLALHGGLALHSWNVYKALRKIAPQVNLNAGPGSLAICGILHDACKINSYRQIADTNRYTIDDAQPLGHGEKSVIVLQQFIELTYEEILAIRWHMGAWAAEGTMQRAALNQAVDASPLLRALIMADLWSAYFTEPRATV